jgi:DNA-binding CsgD family transcriptional regulator
VESQARASAATVPDFSSHEPLRSLGLTDREAEVLLWIAQGKSNSEIAIILNISEPTAKKHVSNLLEKLELDTRANAMLRAIEVLMGRP